MWPVPVRWCKVYSLRNCEYPFGTTTVNSVSGYEGKKWLSIFFYYSLLKRIDGLNENMRRAAQLNIYREIRIIFPLRCTAPCRAESCCPLQHGRRCLPPATIFPRINFRKFRFWFADSVSLKTAPNTHLFGPPPLTILSLTQNWG